MSVDNNDESSAFGKIYSYFKSWDDYGLPITLNYKGSKTF